MGYLIVKSRGLLALLAALASASCGLWMDDDAKLTRALSAFETGEPAAAIVDLKNVLPNRPDSTLAWKYLGLASADMGDFIAAESALERARALGAPVAEFRVTLTEAKLALGEAEDALELADPSLALDQSEEFRIRLQRGDAYAQLGRMADALQSYELAAQLPAPRSMAWLRSAQVHWSNGNVAAARALIDLALAEDGDNPDVNLTLAALMLDSNELEAARRVLGQALERLPLDLDQRGDFLAYLARTQLAKNDIVAARAAIDELLTIWPAFDPDAQLLRAELALAARDFDSAAQLLQAYLAEYLDPGRPTVLLGQALLGRGLLHQAEAHLSAAIAAEPLDIEARKLLARAHLIGGNPARARSTLSQALAFAADDDGLLGLLGLSNLVQEPIDRSSELYDALINGDPHEPLDASAHADSTNDGYVLSVMGLARLAQGRPADAIDYLSRAVAAQPSNVDYKLNLALAYLSSNDSERGSAVLEEPPGQDDISEHELNVPIRRALLIKPYQLDSTQAHGDPRPLLEWLEANPLDQQVRTLVADVYLDREAFTEAATHYERLATADSVDAVVLNNLAWCYANLGDSRALELARRALELDPNDGAIADTLGWVLVSSGQADAGLTFLRQAALLEPGDPLIRLHLAQALAETGAADQARAKLESLLETEVGATIRQNAHELLNRL